MRNLRTALTIAGSDSGGGAGIQTDLKTFAALGVHGTSAITCVTAQNPQAVLGIEPVSIPLIQAQLAAIYDGFRPAAAKTGMLYSAAIIEAVAGFLRAKRFRQVIIDPVMVSTSGVELLRPNAVRLLVSELLPLALLATPNLFEAELLLERRLKSVEDLRKAARDLHARFGCAALVKGGHLRGLKVAADVFFDGKQELLLTAPFVKGVSTHGTGCTYSAAITAYLARGLSLVESVMKSKEYISQTIAQTRKAGKQNVLNTSWALDR